MSDAKPQPVMWTLGAQRRTDSFATLATIIGLLVAVYLGFLVSGRIETSQRLDATSVALLVAAAGIILLILMPRLLEDLKSVEYGTLKFDLDRVRERQDSQQDELSLIKLILPLLLPDKLPIYLRYLENSDRTSLMGSHELRRDIRTLAAARLVERLPGKVVSSELADGKVVQGLNGFLALTDLGRQWVDEIKKAEKPEKPPE